MRAVSVLGPTEGDMASELWRRTRHSAKAVGRVIGGTALLILQMTAEYAEQPAPCSGCHREYVRKIMFPLYDVPAYAERWWLRFCAECRERMRAEYHYEGMLRDEQRKVLAQVKRAIEKGLPGTLTLDQWLATLEYFECLCAYCQAAPYEAIEHCVPIERGGGTTVDNCVPACKTCNSAKGARHPDEIRESSRPPVAVARVREYLRAQVPPPPARPIGTAQAEV